MGERKDDCIDLYRLPDGKRLKISNERHGFCALVKWIGKETLEQNARFLNRALALVLCFYRNFCPKTASHFSEIALDPPLL